MAISGSIGIIADDLTGAGDTALQFFMKGSNTEIVLEPDSSVQNHLNIQTWAISTETRNKDGKYAVQKAWDTASCLKKDLNIEKFYKKIDSTLRGNVALETLSVLNAIEYDAAVIAPAFIQEGRMTIGGYQLLKGVPIERTDAARDTYAPIFESYIPDILKKQINENMHDTIGLIELKTVMKGAFNITAKLNQLIEEGKKLIVVDAISLVDMEQIVLSIEKSRFKILPVGSAGLANALSQIWLPNNNKEIVEKKLPVLPKLILSGSKTSVTSAQIDNLALDDDIENSYFIDLKLDDILNPDIEGISSRIVSNFGKNNVVVVHVSKLDEELQTDEAKEKLIDEGITKDDLANKITDYLAEIAYMTDKLSPFVLITVGGETSYKCTKALNCKYLQITDTVLPAISLCIDSNAKFIVTKSGNMGSTNALIDIINYFKHHEQ